MPFDGSNFKRLVKQITTGDYYEPKHPSCKYQASLALSYLIQRVPPPIVRTILFSFAAASSLIRSMLTVEADKRATISDICSHWWVNEGFEQSCLKEAEHLAGLTPVRLDLLLTLAPTDQAIGAVVVQQEEDEPEVVLGATTTYRLALVQEIFSSYSFFFSFRHPSLRGLRPFPSRSSHRTRSRPSTP